MPRLIVRNVDEALVRALEQRAAENGRSVEAEHREILRQSLALRRSSLKKVLASMPDVGTDEDFAPPPSPHGSARGTRQL